MAKTTSPATLLAALRLSFSFVPFLALAAPHCGLVPPELSALAVQTTPSSGGGNNTVDVVATGWYPGWLGADLPPDQISWSNYSALTFAFA
jgi:chitinase